MAGIRLCFIAPRFLVLLSLFAFGLTAFVSVGCLTELGLPTPPADGPGGPKIPDDPSVDSTAAPEAFFVLHGTDIRGVGFPEDYLHYRIFVCDPSLSPFDVAEVRRRIPGAVLLAYTNTQDVPLGFHLGNPYYNALAAVFDSSLCVRDLTTGNVVRQYAATSVPGSGMPHYIVQETTAEILVAFHRDVTMLVDFDGLYLDQSNALYPPWRRAMLEALPGPFDSNGDGLADSVPAAQFQYREWRRYFTTRLREELGPDAVVIGNSGGAMVDANLNGITLEGVGDRFTIAQAKSHMLGQKAVSTAPFFGVFWATTLASEQPSRALAVEIPGVHYGVIDPDG
jgi:hypothetical protein